MNKAEFIDRPFVVPIDEFDVEWDEKLDPRLASLEGKLETKLASLEGKLRDEVVEPRV